MPDIDDKVYMLDTRVSDVEKCMATLTLSHEHHTDRVDHVEDTVLKHMTKEEKDREIMEEKLDGLLRYKWILFGMAVMMWLTSGENQILQLIKAIH